MENAPYTEGKKNALTGKTWAVMAALAVTGQIAWAMENT